MREEILINVTPREARVALVENGTLHEIYIERANKLGLVGNIYKGRVVRVLPGMQAAFIDIGLERTAFLHQADLLLQEPPISIESVLREGQELLVQIVKDPVNGKGARLTTDLSIASRSLVFVPRLNQLSISLKIIDPLERERLKLLLTANGEDDASNFIIRTVAEGVQTLEKDKSYLLKQWAKITHRIPFTKSGELVYQDLSLILRTLRDIVSDKTERIRVDDPNQVPTIKEFISDFVPEFVGQIDTYQDLRPIFDLYGINDEINKALQRKVPLKSGGYLIIDQTEAMTTIDVNTGAFVGNKNLEETVYRTNLEAVGSLCRQLRLRNLGGIIIIDFIDMNDDEHCDRVLRALENELLRDNVKTTISSSFSPLGLLEMTRKRTRESLQHCLCEQCHTCNGRGFVNSIETVICEIFREINRSIKIYPTGSLLVIAAPAVIEHLLEKDSVTLTELQTINNKTIKLQVETLYTQEQFDVVLL